MIKLLDKNTFVEKATMVEYSGTNWNELELRWGYHKAAIDLIKGITSPGQVLELGSLGVQLVEGSDTMDYAGGWNIKGWRPTVEWDARDIPWPVMKGEYKLFIALRVWQHLGDKQERAFREAKRIADNIIIVVPETYKTGFGVKLEQFIEWNEGMPPDVYKKLQHGQLFLWNK